MKIDVVQFNKSHKWCGCLGIINEVRPDGVYKISVPIPNNEGESRVSYIFAKKSEVEYIGKAVMVYVEEEEQDGI